jgi:hypothetical protein
MDNSIDPAVQDVHWHGDQTLVFLARLDGKSTAWTCPIESWCN